MKDFDCSRQLVLGFLFALAAGACASDDDPVNNEHPTAGAAGNTTSLSTGGTSTGGTLIATTAPATFAGGGVAGAGGLQYAGAGDGSVPRGAQGGTGATTSSGFAGVPVKRCRRNQDCGEFPLEPYLCFIPAVVNGCDEGPLGFCTRPATAHCSLYSAIDPCGSCLVRPDGIQWELPSESRVTTAVPDNFALSCSYCVLPNGGGTAGSPSTSGPGCSDVLRNAAGNAGVAGCSANSAGSGGVN